MMHLMSSAIPALLMKEPQEFIMSLKHSIALALAATSLLTVSTAGFAASHKFGKGFAIVDANSGQELANDGKLDGKACAVGLKAVFDVETQTFRQVPAVKCNFQNAD